MKSRGEYHPRPQALAAFLAGDLAPEEVRDVVAHLLGGCEACRLELRPHVASLWPEAAPPEEAYELAAERASAAALDFNDELESARVAAAASFAAILAGEPLAHRPRTSLETWVWCDLLIGVSEVRGLPRAETVELARAAVALAEGLSPRPFAEEDLADLRARAWAALGNARRLADDLDGAESALARAFACLAEGSGDPRLAARLADLTGSLFRAQRRFPEAYAALDACRDLYLAVGERHLAGRTLITKVAALVLEGSTEAALAVTAEAFALLEGQREPELVLFLAHNALLALVDIGQHEKAGALLWRVRRLTRTGVVITDQARLVTLEARIEAAAGRLDRAEELFREAFEGFRAAGRSYPAAVVAIDLSGVLLAAGRPAEALPLLDDALELFRLLKINREAMAAVVLLRQAAVQGEATSALARATVSMLGRLSKPEVPGYSASAGFAAIDL